MAEAIAFDVATNILTKLVDAAFRQICLVYGVDDDLENLKETLITINAARLDADRRQEEELIKDWIRKLNDVVYDADDVLDAFNTKNLQRQLKIDGRAKMQVSCEFFSYSNQLVFRYKMSRKIKKIRERLDGIASTMSKYKFAITERVLDRARVGGSYRESVSYVPESHVIGREKEKEELIDMLMRSSNEENVSIVSIVGIGGLGKTTLAQSVYSEKRVVDHFELMIWVCVSEDFEKKSLVRRILKSITNNEVGDLEMEQLERKLRGYIDGKRYLLILDDIWNEDPLKWIDVKPFLEGGAQGSKILVTTRSTKVTSAMDAENTYILEGLTKEQSWSLFEKVAFRGHKEVHAYMKSVGKEIIIRCKGVPLAIRSLGSVMQSKTKESEWLAIQNSDIWSYLDSNISILPILKLSYDHLPIHLRQCFVYCSIFPKDHTLKKDLLVQLWMAQGYIQSSGESQDLEDIGDQYFEDLISRSFLQDVQVTSGNVYCKMHDLIHDLAIKIVGPRYCSIAKNSSVNISERVNHVSFGLLENVPTQLIQAKGLRTYFSTEDFHPWSTQQQARPNKLLLSKIRQLRALDLRGCGFEKLPNLVGKMQHLRFLDLSWNREMVVLPNSITNLVNLQTLNLSSCDGLKELPEGISKLISLRHLIISNCHKITRMPRGLGKLTSLRTLSDFVVDDDKRSAKLGELNGLNNLRGICIENLEKVRGSGSESKEANLMGKQYLKSLTLHWSWSGGDFDKDVAEIVLEGLQPHPNLKELKIVGYYGVRFPSWIISLPNIVKITLCNCPNIRQLPPFYQLPCLKTLHLLNLPEVQYDDGSSSSSFSPSFPSLTHLYIFNCPKLTSMPGPPLLETLELHHVSQKLLYQLLTTATRTTTAATIPSSSPLSRLTDLSIYHMEGIESLPFFPEGVPQNLTSLMNLYIEDCPRLLHLAVSGEIQHLTALEDLTIRECEELDLTRDGMNWQGLRSLRRIVFIQIPKLVSLPEGLQHITTLQFVSILHCPGLVDLPGGTSSSFSPSFPCLTHLYIKNCPKLTSMPCPPLLEKLEIKNCPTLTSMPCPPLLETLRLSSVSQKLLFQVLTTATRTTTAATFPSSSPLSRLTTLSIRKMEDSESLPFFPEGVPQNLTSLKNLSIQRCPRLLHLAVSGEIQHLTALEDLYIDGCKELDLTDDGMNWQGLRSLRRIHIENIPKLVSLPEGLQHITTLEYLQISECKELDLTRDGMNWQGLRSLREIVFINIPKLVSLPEGLQHITTLEDLQICDCEELDLTDDGMNWQGLRSLRKIYIRNIPKLVSLPEGLQHITTLEHLTISDCEELDLTRDGMNWQGLRSLRNIYISNIPKLVSLPEGLQHITTLQSVCIEDCPGLVDLPEWTSNIPSLYIPSLNIRGRR